MYGRTYTVPGVPFTMSVSANEAICLHAAPWQENAGKPFGVPRSHGCVRMPLNTPVGCSTTPRKAHPSRFRPESGH